RAVRLKQLEMASATYRVPPQPRAADRVLPGLFEDEEDDAPDGPLLDLPFPIDAGELLVEPLTPATLGPPPRAPGAFGPVATPQAIEVPIAAIPRPAPRALVVFAAYALLGAAIVLLAGALRWTRGEHASAVAAPAMVACPPGMARGLATDGGATACQPAASSATSSMRVISAPGPTRIGGPQ
ncbi:MAG TPA: hypothetical protein VHS09_17820, partial [Polyangiaceae bacterium]|nr:hypothetical protein [Polyangiaceae bacterium]